MKVDVVASQPHYLRHLEPIFAALKPEQQGKIHPLGTPCPEPVRGRLALVAGWPDVEHLLGRTEMVYVEHGAGQSYGGDPRSANMPGYANSGGIRHSGVVGFIAPNDATAALWRTAPTVSAGCPKMDRYHAMFDAEPYIQRRRLCIAWHWDAAMVCEEARSAVDHYAVELPAIVAEYQRQRWEVVAHHHPRWGRTLDDLIMRSGFDAILDTDDEVFRTCDLLMMDNSSLAVEFMSLDRPVVWLNAPWYRRGVRHGGRFWNWIEGALTADGPEDLIMLDLQAASDPRPWREERKRIVDTIYNPATRGRAAAVAADFIDSIIQFR
jgi:hypothetical protein